MYPGSLGKIIQQAHQNSGLQKAEDQAALHIDPCTCQGSQVDAQAATAYCHRRARDPERTRWVLVTDEGKELQDGKGKQRVAES